MSGSHRGRPRKKARNTTGLTHKTGTPRTAPTFVSDDSATSRDRVEQPPSRNASESEWSDSGDDEDAEDCCDDGWEGFGDEELGEKLGHAACDLEDDPNDIDWIPPRFRWNAQTKSMFSIHLTM